VLALARTGAAEDQAEGCDRLGHLNSFTGARSVA
jgi:hypothetical protein